MGQVVGVVRVGPGLFSRLHEVRKCFLYVDKAKETFTLQDLQNKKEVMEVSFQKLHDVDRNVSQCSLKLFLQREAAIMVDLQSFVLSVSSPYDKHVLLKALNFESEYIEVKDDDRGSEHKLLALKPVK